MCVQYDPDLLNSFDSNPKRHLNYAARYSRSESLVDEEDAMLSYEAQPWNNDLEGIILGVKLPLCLRVMLLQEQLLGTGALQFHLCGVLCWMHMLHIFHVHLACCSFLQQSFSSS